MSFVTEIKQFIIDTLNLEDVQAEDIVDHEPLFNEGLGLDSIDALELGMAIKKNYGVELKGENSSQHFASAQSLAQFIEQARA